MSNPVSTEIQDGVAIVTIDNPPVNALSAAVRQGIAAAIDAAEADATVTAIVLIAAGRTYPAGADIREFGKPPVDPWLPEVCNRIEAAAKPVVAAIHGTALGGGYETCLAAHWRIAEASAKIGLPEINLGILPGAGGTQRAPRLAGPDVALELMTDGRPLPAPKAAELGLVDEIAEGGLKEAAIARAKALGADGRPIPTRDRREHLIDAASFDAALARYRSKFQNHHIPAALKIVDCVEAAQLLPFEVGLAFERTAFQDCLASEASQGLRHAFFAERLAPKFPGLMATTPTDIGTAGVVGGGTMGAGITAALLNAGLRVTLVEQDAEALDRAEKRLLDLYAPLLRKNRLDEATLSERLSRLTVTTSLGLLNEVELVIEAVVEDMDAKAGLFTSLNDVLTSDAILASNTSYLDLDQLAEAYTDPRRVIGLHFFSPAERMKLLEIVVGEKTSPNVTATALQLAKRLGKIPVRSGVADGFIGNRLLTAYRTAADYMLEDGASPYEIDAAMRDFGFPMGPYQVIDMAGLDISWARRKRLAPTRDPAERYVTIGDALCEAGWFGRKSGQGYYAYSEDAPKGAESPDTMALIESIRGFQGKGGQSFSPDEIRNRCLLAMVAAGARLIEEGVALRPSDVDVVMVHGFGFPRWRGGPMKWADMQGMLAVQNDLNRLSGEAPNLWSPAPVFAELIKNGQDFSALNPL